MKIPSQSLDEAHISNRGQSNATPTFDLLSTKLVSMSNIEESNGAYLLHSKQARLLVPSLRRSGGGHDESTTVVVIFRLSAKL